MPTTNLLAGKTAIITGGTTGIGRGITLAFLVQGCNVAVNHLGLEKDRPHLASLIAEAEALLAAHQSSPGVTIGRLAHLPGDIRDPSTATALVSFALTAFDDRSDDDQNPNTTAHTLRNTNNANNNNTNTTTTPNNTENNNNNTTPKRRRLDICVSNAGICTFATFLDLDHALYENTIQTNLNGTFYLVQAAARQMALHNSPPGGSIIGISSISALVGGGLQTHYTPTKAGITSLMQSTAVALGRYNIRCNALLPGTVSTQLNEEDLQDEGKRAYMQGRIPLGRIGRPEDLGGPAVFLACEELSSYVTGAQLLVDGGLFVNLQ